MILLTIGIRNTTLNTQVLSLALSLKGKSVYEYIYFFPRGQ